MKKRTRSYVLLACAVAATASMAYTEASLAATKSKLTIMTRGGGYHRDWWLDTLAAFKKSHPNIQVNEQFVGDTITAKFLTASAAGAAPDVVQIFNFVTPLAAKGVLEPLDSYLEHDKVNRNIYFPYFLEMGSYNGKLYAIDSNPAGSDVVSQGINQDMFDAAGVSYSTGSWRWEIEGLSAAKKITKDLNGDGKYDQFFYDGSNLNAMHRAWWIWQVGGNILETKGGKTVLGCADADSLKGLQFAIDMINKYHYAPDSDDQKRALAGEQPWTAFYSKPNKIAMIEGGRAQMVTYKSKFNFRLTPKLTYNNERATGAVLRTPWAIAKGAKNKEAAWTFIKWITSSDEAQKLVAKWGQGQPVVKTKAVWDAVDSYSDPEDVKVNNEIVAKGLTGKVINWPTHPAWNDVGALYANAVNKSISQNKPIATCMKEIEAQANAILARFKYRI